VKKSLYVVFSLSILLVTSPLRVQASHSHSDVCYNGDAHSHATACYSWSKSSSNAVTNRTCITCSGDYNTTKVCGNNMLLVEVTEASNVCPSCLGTHAYGHYSGTCSSCSISWSGGSWSFRSTCGGSRYDYPSMTRACDATVTKTCSACTLGKQYATYNCGKDASLYYNGNTTVSATCSQVVVLLEPQI